MQDTAPKYHSSYLLNHLDSTEVSLPYKEFSFVDNVTDVFGVKACIVGTGVEEKAPFYDTQVKQNIASELSVFAILLFIVAFYSIMIMLCKKSITQLFKSFSYKEVVEKLSAMVDVNMERLLRMSDCVMCLMIAFAVMSLSRFYLNSGIDVVYVFVITLAVMAAYYIYNMLLVKSLQYISESEDFFGGLKLLNRSNTAIGSVIFLPIVLFISFVDFRVAQGAAIFSVVLAVILIINYLITLLGYFRRENVSFLEYILYLCGAQIVPISFVIIFTLRNYLG